MPEDFHGSFSEHLIERQRQLEAQYREEAGDEADDAEISERAEDEAQFLEAHDWLMEKWGEDSPCPICSNVRWIVSPVTQAYNGFLSFHVTCRYCGNSMAVIPGHTDLEEPEFPGEQLELPEP